MKQQKVGIVDYEMGNTKSVLNAIRNVGGVAKIISNPDDFLSFDKLILPGVGAFGKAMRIINNTGMRSALDDFKKTGNYILGICLGMQIMCSSSEEDENEVGLSWFPAKVQALEPKLGFNILFPCGILCYFYNVLTKVKSRDFCPHLRVFYGQLGSISTSSI